MAIPVGVTTAEADAYFTSTPRDADWQAVTTKDVFLNDAYRLLTAICYDQTRDCCGRDFGAAWIAANSELALALSKNPNAIIGGGGGSTGTTGAIKRNQLGDLVQEFYDVKDGQSLSTKYGPTDPLVLQRFPWLGDILGCWMTLTKSSGTRVIARVRS